MQNRIPRGAKPPPPRCGGIGLPGDLRVDALWMAAAKRLAALVHIHENRAIKISHDRFGHNIGCILVAADGNILAWGVNTNTGNATRHAETKCVRMYQRLNPGQRLPEGATLYTTLQSCLMCAGTIHHAAGGNRARVVFLDHDHDLVTCLKEGASAREQRLYAAPGLGAGQHLLAAARWERLRRTITGPPPEKMNKGKTRALLMTTAGADGKTPVELKEGTFARGAIDQRVSDEAVNKRARVIVTAQLPALKARLAGEKKLSTMPVETGKLSDAARKQIEIENQPLSRERAQRSAMEALHMRDAGGAPIMLLDRHVIQQMERPLLDLLDFDEKTGNPVMQGATIDQQITLYDTAIYIITLLQQVLTIVDDYRAC